MKIADALIEQGQAVPDDLLPVDVWLVAAPYQDAFAVLSACRGHNESGWLALVYSEIVTYARENGFAESIAELEEFVRLMQAQDSTFLEQAAATRRPS